MTRKEVCAALKAGTKQFDKALALAKADEGIRAGIESAEEKDDYKAGALKAILAELTALQKKGRQ
jgi:hypothetical protein